MRAAFLSYQVAGAIGAFVRQNRKEGTPAMNILADPNMTDSEAALAAPAPFVELRRGYYGAIAIDPAYRAARSPRQLPAPAQGHPRTDPCPAARAFPQTG